MKPGYCTNIHSGTCLADVLDNLVQYTVPIKQAVSSGESMSIGLWLSHQAVAESLAGDGWQKLAGFLRQHDLIAQTFNAFPSSDFHEPVVKHAVYLPTWAEPARLDYTMQVAELQHRILPDGIPASISTVPIGWSGGRNRVETLHQASRHLRSCARYLAGLAERTGRQVCLALEPEPGCELQTSKGLCEFFQQYLLAGGDDSIVRQHIGVCHDVCHAAVMFEPQEQALDRYARCGITLAKVQISSAIESRLSADAQRGSTIDELADFVEPRYLHQTSVRGSGGTDRFFEDLSPAIDFLRNNRESLTARTHFHVPVHLSEIGRLGTTQGEIDDCLRWIAGRMTGPATPHLEVETYAWSVAPEALRGGSLADSVVSELHWLHHRLNGYGIRT